MTIALFGSALFLVGTAADLVAMGVGAQTLLAPFRRRLPAFSAAVVLVMGLLSMSGRLLPRPAQNHDAHASHASPSTTVISTSRTERSQHVH
jgi:sulfite exporter TauE/SafE